MNTCKCRPFSFEAADDVSRLEVMKLTPGERIMLALDLQELGLKLTDAIERAGQSIVRPNGFKPRSG